SSFMCCNHTSEEMRICNPCHMNFKIASLAAPHQEELYQRLKFERGVKLDPSRAWCPVLECQSVCSVQASTEGQPAAVACPTCHTVFCSSCRGPWVDSHTCHERQPMIPPPLSDESRLVSWFRQLLIEALSKYPNRTMASIQGFE
ncbi:hypothetical protein GOODEAATRI_030358, partial [Goodea atripinnis]